MQDAIIMAAIATGPLALMAAASFFLSFFVALKAEPTRRAAWTAGLAYAGITLLCLLSLQETLGSWMLLLPFAFIPHGLLVYWYWRRELQAAWVEGEQELLDGDTMANDDWRMGVVALIALFAIAALKVFLRQP